MHRDILHACAATITLALGLVAVGEIGFIGFIAPLALVAFVLTGLVLRKYFTIDRLKVILLTVLIWVPFAGLVLNFGEEICGTGAYTFESPTSYAEGKSSRDEMVFQDRGTKCKDMLLDPRLRDSVWVGVVDSKVSFKPKVNYIPSLDRDSVVPVSVLIDQSGEVLWAQSLSGPAGFRPLARDVACRARFRPAFIDGPRVVLHGILTFHFQAARSGEMLVN
jgi:hypothetical protein